MKTLVAFLLLLGSLSSRAAERQVAAVDPRIEDRLRAGDAAVPVLVAFRPDAAAVVAGARAQSPRAIVAAVDDALAGLPVAQVSVARRYQNAPMVAASVTREGLDALRRRPGVFGVSLDGVVSAAGDTEPQQALQAGPALMRADLVSTGGLNGYGRAVAVIDSGIDATHPDLGGAPAPNAKVRAGWNVVDGNADVTDCSGHGTAVAGVIASPLGIAPDAALVPLRVFSAADGCQSTRFSAVLSAVDWAISHREENRIDVLNLSLADSRVRPGFCDAEDPATASVFQAARRAGIAVVVAAGNGGRKVGLAWPACFSDVISVGMVYSAPGGQVWWGEAACHDEDARADSVPCASNSGPALSLLAPGVRWSTDAPGGSRRSDFSGTSAAAPAAAAALLLLRQTRPYEDPQLAAELLRASGTPLVDAAGGRVTPRVDLAAALASTTPVSGPCRATASGLECTAEVGSVEGPLARATLALSIDHPDPSRLSVTLTAPDGTAATVGVASLRELQAPATLAGHPAAGRWRLSIADPLGTARIVSWALVLTPEPAKPAPAFAPAARAWLPAAVHQAGTWGAFFTTDLRLVNADRDAARTVTLGVGGQRLQMTLPPGGTRMLDDVLHNAFRSSGASPLWIAADGAVSAQARTVSTAPMGAGAAVTTPLLSPARALADGERALLQPAWSAEGGRLNVALLETAGAEARAQVSIRGWGGAMKGTASTVAAPGALTQVHDVYAAIGAAPETGDLVEVAVVGGAGRVLALATSLDNRTNAGLGVPAAEPVSRASVPVGDGPVELLLATPGSRAVRVGIAYASSAGEAFPMIVVPVGAGETRVLSDVLAYFTGAPSGGALRVVGLEGAEVLVAARQFLASGPGIALPVLPDEPAAVTALPFLGPRSRLGLAETAGSTARARVSLLAADGTLLASQDVALPAGGTLEWPALPAIPEGTEATALVETLEGRAGGWSR